MSDVYLVDGVRTPIGNFQGSLAPLSAAALGKVVVTALLRRCRIEPQHIDQLIFGNVLQAGLGQNIARQVALAAGMSQESTALTTNMVCGSGLMSVAQATQAIRCGDADLVVAGGAESMSNAPYLLRGARAGLRMGNDEIVDVMLSDGLTDAFNGLHMGLTAEEIAARFDISRAAQDACAASSQNRAEAAMAAGRFRDEIVDVLLPQKKGEPVSFSRDEFVRTGITAQSLAGLRPAFKKDGCVTAGNSSGINDGAAAVLVAGANAVAKHQFTPLARVVSYASAGVDPMIMGMGPVKASQRALAKAGWEVSDLELVEANEAFAAQALAVSGEMKWNPHIVNVNGGAIALGHPIGASGCRILVTLIHEMKRRQAKRGLATLCIGGGMGVAMCIERNNY